jgi:uncharacterized protein (DUF58 family)
MGFAAVNTGNNLLFLIVSSLLAFMAVSGFAGWLNLRRLQVAVVFPDEIYDCTETLVAVRLENRKQRIPSFLLRVGLLDGAVRFPLVDAGGGESDVLTLCFRGRGRKDVATVLVSSPFPINFFVRRRTLAVNGRYVVFPAPLMCRTVSGAEQAPARGEAFSRQRGSGGDLATIRDYTGSEPMKLIHWRHSARHEGLKVKELTAPAAVPLTIDVQALPGAAVAERLSCAAYLVNKAVRAGRPVGLKLGSRILKPALSRAHRLRLLEELAVYGTD